MTHICILLWLFLAWIAHSVVSVKHVSWRIPLCSCGGKSNYFALLAYNRRLLSYFDINILLKNLNVSPLLIFDWCWLLLLYILLWLLLLLFSLILVEGRSLQVYCFIGSYRLILILMLLKQCSWFVWGAWNLAQSFEIFKHFHFNNASSLLWFH